MPWPSSRAANAGLVGDLGREPAAPARWNDLGLRVASAALMAPVALACIWVGGPAFTVLIAAAAAGLASEWTGLYGLSRRGAPSLLVAAPAVLATVAAALGPAWLGLSLLLAGCGAVWAGAGRPGLAAGVAYVGLAGLALIWLRQGGAEIGRANVLVLVLIVWASDIAAYTCGRLLDGPKLAPRLSPRKTWSGAIGGLIAAILVGQAAALAFNGVPTVRASGIAAILGIATQAGDLLESGVKRHFGVKDSGRLIPGHGGLLDRLDGLLAAAPVAALAVLIGRGGYLWQ